MKSCKFLGLIFAVVALLTGTGSIFASDTPSIQVMLQRPKEILKMGDIPAFTGVVTNIGRQTLKGLIVYPSLVSLESGNERPLDLEDWSAQRAVRIEQLSPGQANTQQWKMRLIQAGRFGIALTVVNPRGNRPVVSNLVHFDVQPKPTLASNRILPVAIGEPLIIILCAMMLAFLRYRRKN